MSRKRRQRSTSIRKRVEKKQREAAKARRRQEKLKKGGADGVMTTELSRGAAETAAKELAELDKRLGAAPIRGWTTHDLSGEHGLTWLGTALTEALGSSDDRNLPFEFPESAKGALSDKLGTLEVAAPGLGVDWDSGLHELGQAIAAAELIVEEEEDEEGENA